MEVWLRWFSFFNLGSFLGGSFSGQYVATLFLVCLGWSPLLHLAVCLTSASNVWISSIFYFQRRSCSTCDTPGRRWVGEVTIFQTFRRWWRVNYSCYWSACFKPVFRVQLIQVFQISRVMYQNAETKLRQLIFVAIIKIVRRDTLIIWGCHSLFLDLMKGIPLLNDPCKTSRDPPQDPKNDQLRVVSFRFISFVSPKQNKSFALKHCRSEHCRSSRTPNSFWFWKYVSTKLSHRKPC